MTSRADTEDAEHSDVGGNLKLKDFIDETAEKTGTDINRAALMAIQGTEFSCSHHH